MKVVLAGGIAAALGVLHLVSTLAMSMDYVPRWFTGQLWLPANGLSDLTPSQGAFWLTVGSFAVPLFTLGLLIGWLGRRGMVPPTFVALLLGGWGTLGAVLFEPSPFILTWIPAFMLLRSRSRGLREAAPAQVGR